MPELVQLNYCSHRRPSQLNMKVSSITAIFVLLFYGFSAEILNEEFDIKYCDRLHEYCNCRHEEDEIKIACKDEYFTLMFHKPLKTEVSFYCESETFDIMAYNLQKYDAIELSGQIYVHNCEMDKVMPAEGLMKSLGLRKVSSFLFSTELLKTVKFDISNSNFSQMDVLFEEAVVDEATFRRYGHVSTLKVSSDVAYLVPDGLFAQLHNLSTLNWRNGRSCCFRTSAIAKLTKLNEILIWFVEQIIESLHPCETFDVKFINMTQLERVTLRNTFHEHIPSDLFWGASSLSYIRISDNKRLSALPVALFSDQVNLTHLDLSSNRIESLPANFFRSLHELQLLNLSYNDFFLLDSGIKTLTKLHTLDIVGNGIELPFNGSAGYIENAEKRFAYLEKYVAHTYVCYLKEFCLFFKDVHGQRCPAYCKCRWIGVAKTLLIDCARRKLKHMPMLPQPFYGVSVLNIEKNELHSLPNLSHYGYNNLTELHLANNNLETLRLSQIPTNLRKLDLSHNRLSQLEANVVQFLNMRGGFLTVRLSGNPWHCDCKSLGIFELVKRNSEVVIDVAYIRCQENPEKTLVSLAETDICPSHFLPILFTGIVILCIFMLLLILFFAYKKPILMWLYEHDCCLWYVAEEDLDADKVYDAFLSYSTNDNEIIPKFIDQLEKCAQPYRLCLHDRDWLVGRYIPENISRSCAQSRRIIVVLSPSFLKSDWGMMEFRLACQAQMEERRKRIIVVIYQDVLAIDEMDEELRAYLKLNTYLRWDDPLFWRKLQYALPHRGRRRPLPMLQNDGNNVLQIVSRNEI